MNCRRWRLEEVDGGDEQYPVESRFAVRHTPPDEQDPRFNRSAPTQVRFLRFAVRHTLPDDQDPHFDHRGSISSVLRYTTPLPINRTPVSTVGGPFPPFCGTPHPSRSTGPRFDHTRYVSCILRYARPRFHRLFRPSPPDEHDHALRSDLAGWLPRVPLPPDEHDAFRCLPMNTTHYVASP